MFELPYDVVQTLKRSHPGVDIDRLFNDIVNSILDKVFSDGSCTIKKFGRFVSFSRYSKLKGKNRVRFKFLTARSFTNKIIDDDYIINKLPIQVANSFNKLHEQRCEDKKNEKALTNIAIKEAAQNERKVKDHRIARNKILEVLMDDTDD